MSEALRALQQRVAAFAAARDWEPYHSPKNLAMAISWLPPTRWCSTRRKYPAERVRDDARKELGDETHRAMIMADYRT
jgi:hypothetical protein